MEEIVLCGRGSPWKRVLCGRGFLCGRGSFYNLSIPGTTPQVPSKVVKVMRVIRSVSVIRVITVN